MSEIKLLLKNRTRFDLIFTYNGIKHDVSANNDKRVLAEAGHRISVNALKGLKAKKREIEGDLFTSILKNDIAIECRLVGWQLQLRIGTGTY